MLADPSLPWTPSDVLARVADQPRDFEPDEQFAYSNSNYIVAGLLLEKVTGVTLVDNLRARIVEPLGLASTYFAPDETRSPIGGSSPFLPGGDTNGDSYHALETAAGAAGDLIGLVAAEQDCCQFVRFAITVDTRGIALEVRGPDGAQPFLASMFGEPSWAPRRSSRPFSASVSQPAPLVVRDPSSACSPASVWAPSPA